MNRTVNQKTAATAELSDGYTERTTENSHAFSPNTETEKELEVVLNSASEGIWICDGEARVLKVNPASEWLNNIKATDVIGRTMPDLLEEKLIDKSVTIEVLKSRERFEMLQTTRDGRKLSVTGIPVYDSDGRLFRVVVIEQDITEIHLLTRRLEEKEALTGRYRDQINELQRAELESGRIVAKSICFVNCIQQAIKVSGVDSTVMLLGESGSGKGVIADLIHRNSSRAKEPMVKVNCGAIPETLVESELFGYEKGAFTGASHRKIGKFEQVNDGTIFLDEIGDMSLSTQAKILRVLQEGCLERLGGDQTIKVDVRIIAATNQNLEKEIEAGRFREDLYYRIKVVTITLPPLRFRKQDIAELIDYFFEKHAITFNKQGLSISPQAVEKMKNYHWPGNIRELENIIKRAIVLCKGNVVTEDLVVEEFQPVAEADVNLIRADFGGANFDELVKKFEGRLYDELIAQTEKTLIEQVLQYTGGNQVQAANILGVSRVMLRERIEKYHIKKQIIIQ